MSEPDYDDEPLPDPDSYRCRGCGVVIKKGDAPHGEWYSTPDDGYRLSCRALDDGRCDCQEEEAIYHVVVTSLAGEEELAKLDVCRTCAEQFDLSELCGGLPMPPPETQQREKPKW